MADRQTLQEVVGDKIFPNDVQLKSISDYLSDNIQKLKVQGIVTGLATLVFAGYLYWDIKESITEHITAINAARNHNQVVAYLIYRSAALGVIATSLIYFGARLTIASFDQAMRFTKRRIGSLFLEHLYVHYQKQIRADVSLAEIMASFEVWNKTVESAFSNVKTERGDNLLTKALLKTVTSSAGKEEQLKEGAASQAPSITA